MKNIFQVFSFDLGSKIISGLLSILLIRFMSDTEYAVYLLVLSIVAVSTGILSSSFNRIYIIGYERLNIEKISSSFLGLQLFGLIIAAILLSPFGLRLGSVYWVLLSLILATFLTEYGRTVFQQQLKFLNYSLIDAARTLLFLISLLVLIFVRKQEPQASEVVLLQAGVAFIVFATAFGPKLNPKEMFHLGQAWRLAKTILQGRYRYLFGYFALLAVFSQLDVFMLKVMGSDFALATYGSAFRYYTILIMALNSIHAVLLPMIQTATTLHDLDRIYHNNYRLFRIVTPILFVGAWSAQWIIPWIDKGKYPEAITVFQVLSISAAISLAFSPHANLVLRFEDFKFLVLVVIVGVILSISLNVVLIPAFGAAGTAVTTLTSFAFVNGMIYIRARGHRQRFKQTQLDLSQFES